MPRLLTSKAALPRLSPVIEQVFGNSAIFWHEPVIGLFRYDDITNCGNEWIFVVSNYSNFIKNAWKLEVFKLSTNIFDDTSYQMHKICIEKILLKFILSFTFQYYPYIYTYIYLFLFQWLTAWCSTPTHSTSPTHPWALSSTDTEHVCLEIPRWSRLRIRIYIEF